MSKKCVFQYDDGRQCKCWANRGSNFCVNHQPEARWHETGEHLHPLARLATPEDLFDVIRETLNAARTGRIASGQAYAVGYLAQLWLQIHEKLSFDYRHNELYNQILPTLVDSASAEPEERAARPMPLPVHTEGASGDRSVSSSVIPSEARNPSSSSSSPAPNTQHLEPSVHIDEKAALEQLRAQGPPVLFTPEQRADLDRHLAEFHQRAAANLEADHSARSSSVIPSQTQSQVLPKALSQTPSQTPSEVEGTEVEGREVEGTEVEGSEAGPESNPSVSVSASASPSSSLTPSTQHLTPSSARALRAATAQQLIEAARQLRRPAHPARAHDDSRKIPRERYASGKT